MLHCFKHRHWASVPWRPDSWWIRLNGPQGQPSFIKQRNAGVSYAKSPLWNATMYEYWPTSACHRELMTALMALRIQGLLIRQHTSFSHALTVRKLRRPGGSDKTHQNNEKHSSYLNWSECYRYGTVRKLTNYNQADTVLTDIRYYCYFYCYF